jgi:uncharacterized protein (TIGR03437 family)
MKYFLLLSLGLRLAASPVIYPHSIINAASFHAPGLPSGPVAQGSTFTILGVALGPASGTQQSAYPLQTTLAGVSIAVTQGSQTVAAIPTYVSQGQINAVMPSNTPLGWVSVRVTYNSFKSNPSPVYVVHDSPGIFTFTGTGLGPAALQNVVSATSLPNNSNQNSAVAGQTEILYLTGLGPISAPDTQVPPVGNLATKVEVWVGGVAAAVSYSGRSPCCSGLDQINFVVPATAPVGCWTPVWVRTSGVTISNFTSMAVNTSGGPCVDSASPFSSTVVKGGGLGLVALTRIAVHQDLGVNTPVDVTSDFVNYAAVTEPGGLFAFDPWLSTPPPGTCSVAQGTGDYFSSGQVPAVSPASLDGGTQMTVNGPGGAQTVTLGAGAAAVLGSYLPLYSFPNQLTLSAGSYTVASNGGANVPPINVPVTIGSPLTWTNRDQTVMVDRTQPLVVNWSGGAGGQTVTIIGVGSDLPTNSSAVFRCYAPAGASSFTIPPQVLGAIPASRSHALSSKDVIYVVSSSGTAFQASGLATAQAGSVYMTGKTVAFK